jgi:uncharacterized protein (DUF2249 family)
VARRFRRSAVVDAIGALRPGGTMRFVNDHDPLPLIARRRKRLAMIYLQRDADMVVIDFGITGLPEA